jgi:hypothetical protein
MAADLCRSHAQADFWNPTGFQKSAELVTCGDQRSPVAGHRHHRDAHVLAARWWRRPRTGPAVAHPPRIVGSGRSVRKLAGPPASRSSPARRRVLTDTGGANLERAWSPSCAEPTSTDVNNPAVTCEFAVSAGQTGCCDIPGGQGVAGSNPVVPTVGWAVSSRWGRRPFLGLPAQMLS